MNTCRKGTFCPYVDRPLFCQEGDKETCEIYRTHHSKVNKEDDHEIAENMRDYWKHLTSLAER